MLIKATPDCCDNCYVTELTTQVIKFLENIHLCKNCYSRLKDNMIIVECIENEQA